MFFTAADAINELMVRLLAMLTRLNSNSAAEDWFDAHVGNLFFVEKMDYCPCVSTDYLCITT